MATQGQKIAKAIRQAGKDEKLAGFKDDYEKNLAAFKKASKATDKARARAAALKAAREYRNAGGKLDIDGGLL